MKNIWINVAMVGVAILIVLSIVLPLITMSKPNAREDVVGNLGPWTNLGTVSNGLRSGIVMRRTDPDTGATIYVLVGTELGGIYVLPAEKDKK